MDIILWDHICSCITIQINRITLGINSLLKFNHIENNYNVLWLSYFHFPGREICQCVIQSHVPDCTLPPNLWESTSMVKLKRSCCLGWKRASCIIGWTPRLPSKWMHKNNVEMVRHMLITKSQNFFVVVSAKFFVWRKAGPVLRGPRQLQFLLTSLGVGNTALEAKGFVLVTLVWYALGEVSSEPVES